MKALHRYIVESLHRRKSEGRNPKADPAPAGGAFQVAVAVILLASLLCTGCAALQRFTVPGDIVQVRPAVTNEIVSSATVTNSAGVVETALVTNTTVSPPLLYTNRVLSPEARDAARLVSYAAQGSGVPYSGIASEALLVGLPTLLLGWYNLWQRRKLRDGAQQLQTTREVAMELRDNVESVLRILPELENERAKERLERSQIAAGPEVAAAIRELLRK